ncbi:MAG: alanine racemase [Candidatus Heimdallarchaeota archaeon]
MIPVVNKPTLLLNVRKAKKNIIEMTQKAKAKGVRFRPHFKTHQSREVGEWFKDVGVSAITVSSMDMAWYFQKADWRDITIAIPCNPLLSKEIDQLAGHCHLNILVESPSVIDDLALFIENEIGVWIEIDVGDLRTGVSWEDHTNLSMLHESIIKREQFEFKGILTHAGQTYKASSPQQIWEVYKSSVERMNEVKTHLEAIGAYNIEISVGDTPSMSLVDDFGKVDEIRPGSFVFYDLTQVALGAAREEDIAIGVACPVIAKNLDRGEIVVHGGAVHLSKETLRLASGDLAFGKVAVFSESTWGASLEDVYVSNISQEHGVIKAPKEFIKGIKYGDVLVILPVHSCLTANLFTKFQTLEGNFISSFHI